VIARSDPIACDLGLARPDLLQPVPVEIQAMEKTLYLNNCLLEWTAISTGNGQISNSNLT